MADNSQQPPPPPPNWEDVLAALVRKRNLSVCMVKQPGRNARSEFADTIGGVIQALEALRLAARFADVPVPSFERLVVRLELLDADPPEQN